MPLTFEMPGKVLAGYMRGNQIAAQLDRHHDRNTGAVSSGDVSDFLILSTDINAIE